MKKLLVVALAITTVFGIVGCGANSESSNATTIEDKDSTAVESGESTDGLESVLGTWQAASISYATGDGDMQPEYYVQFVDSEIKYGHMADDEFVLDHTDTINSIDVISEGKIRIQAESDNGIKYTYQTGENDDNVLEYYETWNEDEFSEMYQGSASLSKAE